MPGALTLGAATSDRVDNGTNAAMDNMDPFTVCALVKLNTLTSQRLIWSKGTGNTKGIRLSGTAGDVQATVLRTSSGGYTTNNAPIAAGVWCFIAFSFNSANAAGSVFKIYSGRIGTPFSLCTYSAAVDGSGTLTSDAGSHSFWGNSALANAAAQGDFAYGAVFNAELSLAELQAWQLAPQQIVGSRAALDFTAFGLYGADAINFAGNANGTVTGGVQTTGPGIATAIDNVQALVTAGGGNTPVFHVSDSRLNTSVSAWKDGLGANNGRAAGLTYAQATGASQPTIANGRLVFNGTKSMATGQDTRLAFDGSAPLYGWVIAKATANGPVLTIAADPTSTAVAPFAGVQVAGGNWKGFCKPTTGSTQFDPDSGVVANDGVIRVIGMGKGTRAGTFEDEAWRHHLRGRQPCQHEQASVATTVSGGLKSAIGLLGATNGTMEICAVVLLAADPSPTFLAALDTYAATFGALPETTKTNTFLIVGDSNMVGTATSDRLTALNGSGTKSSPYLCVNDVTNTRGVTLTAEGWDTADIHKYNISHGGNNIDDVIAALPRTVAPVIDGLRTGPAYVMVWCIGGSALLSHLTFATMKTRWITLQSMLHGYGNVKLITVTATDGGTLGASTFGLYNATSPSLVKSTEGQAVFDFHAELRANMATYTDYLVDMDNLSQAAPFARACDNTGFFNGDKVHHLDALTALVGPFLRLQVNAIAFSAAHRSITAGLAGGFFTGSL